MSASQKVAAPVTQKSAPGAHEPALNGAHKSREEFIPHAPTDDLDDVVGNISRAHGNDGDEEDVRFDLEVGAPDKKPTKKAAGLGTVDDDGYAQGGADGDAPESVRHTVNAMLNVLIPYGGMLSTGFNLASTSIGAGILGLPAAFNNAGTIMAVTYLALITAETVYSMRLLAQVAEKTGLRSFEEMGTYLLFPRADIFVAIIRALHTYGGAVAYVVTIGDLLQPILEAIDGTPAFLLNSTGRKLLQTGFWLVFMFPLVFARNFNSLRYVSAFGILFIIYFSAIVIVHSGMNGLRTDPRPATKLVNTGNVALNAVGVFTFSFMCQIAALELYWELRNRNVRSFTLCATISMTICSVLYFLVGLFGYLDFGESVKGSILLHYNPIQQPQVFVAYIGIFIKICASFGLLNNACRCAVFPILGWDPKTISFKKHALGAIIIAVVALALGLFIPNVNSVFSLTGGVAGGLVGFILPALFIMYAGNWTLKSVGIVNYVCTYLTLIAGCVAFVFGSVSAVAGFIM